MQDQLVPILYTKNGMAASEWYARLGFEIESQHRFAPGMPLYLFLKRGNEAIHLSEHRGDAKPDTLLYFYVSDIESLAKEFDVEIKEQPWAQEIHLSDPDGNRFRIGKRRESET